MIICVPSGFNAQSIKAMSNKSREILVGQYFLPPDFEPSNKDIICGRARENFHHDGNRYFRDLIQQNVGPYLAARTKLEKSEAIAMIVEKVNRQSPTGGFIKKDSTSGRWYKIKDSEAKDKCGHAVRKAVQRLEDTKPKLAARIKEEYMAKPASLRSAAKDTTESSSSSQTSERSSLASALHLPNAKQESSAPEPGKHMVMQPHGNKLDFKALPMILERTHDPARPRIQQSDPPSSLNIPLQNASIHGLPPRNSIQSIESAALLAARMMAQRQPALPLHYTNILGLSGRIQPQVSAEKIWLESALQKQREAQLSSELTFARQLALSALQNITAQRINDQKEKSDGNANLRNDDNDKSK